ADRVDIEVALDVERSEDRDHGLPDELAPDADAGPGLRVAPVVECAQRPDAEEGRRRRVGIRRVAADRAEEDGDRRDHEDDQDAAAGRDPLLDLMAGRALDPDVLAEPDVAEQL